MFGYMILGFLLGFTDISFNGKTIWSGANVRRKIKRYFSR